MEIWRNKTMDSVIVSNNRAMAYFRGPSQRCSLIGEFFGVRIVNAYKRMDGTVGENTAGTVYDGVVSLGVRDYVKMTTSYGEAVLEVVLGGLDMFGNDMVERY